MIEMNRISLTERRKEHELFILITFDYLNKDYRENRDLPGDNRDRNKGVFTEIRIEGIKFKQSVSLLHSQMYEGRNRRSRDTVFGFLIREDCYLPGLLICGA